MISHENAATPAGALAVLCDSISFVTEDDAGAVVVCASHGGASSGEYAARYPLDLVIFNDAGVGKDDAGIQALQILERHGVAACAVSHDTARIGDVKDQWEYGVVSYANQVAGHAIRPGMAVQAAVDAWIRHGREQRPNPDDGHQLPGHSADLDTP